MSETNFAKDGTWLLPINGEARNFQPTLENAIRHAMQHGECDLTNSQALAYARQYPLTDNQGEPHELYREIMECGSECDHSEPGSMCFTTVVADDKDEQESMKEFLAGYNCYRVVRNENYMRKLVHASSASQNCLR